ncbi:MAG: hypothetical protein ACK6A9_19185 [Dolichospermum sp.]|jgi:hypothetical protein
MMKIITVGSTHIRTLLVGYSSKGIHFKEVKNAGKLEDFTKTGN